MKKCNLDLKIKDGMKVEGIVDKFEKENPIVKSICSLKQYTNKLVLICIAYIIVIIIIQKIFYMMSIFLSIIFSFFIIRAIYKQAGEISYIYSKNIGGKEAKYIFKKENGVLQTISYNLTLMKKEEWRLINKILRINYLNDVNSIKELKDYFAKAKIQEKHKVKRFIGDFLGSYLIPVTAIIISIYTSIFNTIIGLEQNIINISYIILGAIIILILSIPIYIVYSIKKFSVTNMYTIPRLEKLLLEIILNKKYYTKNITNVVIK